MTHSRGATTREGKRTGPIQAPAMLVAGPKRDTYSITAGNKEPWVLVNETGQSRVGPVETWERVYEFFEFYQRSEVYEVIDA